MTNINLYYSPEKAGLEIVGVLDEEGLSYEFNTLVVWKQLESGALYWDKDSGCSCPTPFENSTLETINKIPKDSLEGFESAVKSFPAPKASKERLLGKVILELSNQLE